MATEFDKKLWRLDEGEDSIRNQEVEGKYDWKLCDEGTSRIGVEERRTSQVQKRAQLEIKFR